MGPSHGRATQGLLLVLIHACNRTILAAQHLVAAGGVDADVDSTERRATP